MNQAHMQKLRAHSYHKPIIYAVRNSWWLGERAVVVRFLWRGGLNSARWSHFFRLCRLGHFETGE